MAKIRLTKFCRGCDRELPITEFWKRPEKGLNAVRPRCKECSVKMMRRYLTTDIGKAAIQKCEARPERIASKSAYHRQYRQTADYRARRKERRLLPQNAAHENAYKQSKRGREVARAAVRRYQKSEKGRERHREDQKVFRKTKLGRLREISRSYRRRASTVISSLSFAELQKLLSISKACYWCKRLFTAKRKPTVDYVLAISRHGTHDLTNIVLACRRCNSSKNNRRIDPITGQGILL